MTFYIDEMRYFHLVVVTKCLKWALKTVISANYEMDVGVDSSMLFSKKMYLIYCGMFPGRGGGACLSTKELFNNSLCIYMERYYWSDLFDSIKFFERQFLIIRGR